MPDFYTHPCGQTVSSDDVAYEVIYRQAQRRLGFDMADIPPAWMLEAVQ